MGGDHLHSFTSEDESSTLDNDDDDCSEMSSYPPSFYRDGLGLRDEDESSRGSSRRRYRGFDEVVHGIASNPVEFDNTLRRRKISYNEIMRNYDELWARRECLYQAKYKILSYSPGAWISNAGNMKLQDYNLPKTTSLLLVGPKGSGKSSLVNRISRVFEDDKFASERAQVTYNSNTAEGTFFLQEYMIPRGSTSFCLFDTRSLSEDFADSEEMLQLWMMKGVRHGELVLRDSDSPRLKTSLKCKSQQSAISSSEIRKVNFVVFVVNGLSILRSMNSHQEEARRYMELVIKTFSCPYVSFKDDKPVIVVTHGDLLSLGDRARVRVYLGEKLGVPPAKQIFDIPDDSDPLTELVIVDMIRYSLEHADRHIPCRESRWWIDRSKFSFGKVKYEVSMSSILTLMFLAMLLGIACVAFPVHRSYKHEHNASFLETTNSRTNHPYVRNEHVVTFPSHTEPKPSINYHQNQKPPTTPPDNLPSESLVNSPEYGNRKSEATISQSSPSPNVLETREQKNPEPKQENQEREVAYNIPSQILSENQRPEKWEMEQDSISQMLKSDLTSSRTSKHENQEREVAYNFPSRSLSANQEQEIWEDEQDSTSQPLKNVATSSPTQRPKSDSQHKSRSLSPEKRHPKAAVKWHKIRHLWLDE